MSAAEHQPPIISWNKSPRLPIIKKEKNEKKTTMTENELNLNEMEEVSGGAGKDGPGGSAKPLPPQGWLHCLPDHGP